MYYHIYCNQKTLNKHYQSAISEFEKRLSAYCNTALHLSTTLSFPKEINKHNHHFLFIHSGPSTYSSEEFALFLKDIQHSGKSVIHIIIGYTEESFYKALPPVADYDAPSRFSLTKSRLANETITLLFYEQLYRGYTILQGKTYHK